MTEGQGAELIALATVAVDLLRMLVALGAFIAGWCVWSLVLSISSRRSVL